MVLVICPMLAGEGILGGLRGEARRIEDKFTSMSMELKTVHVALDHSASHGNRTCFVKLLSFNSHTKSRDVFFTKCIVASNSTHPCRSMPSLLPAWVAMLENTLGCRQGTLYKAPRNSDKDLRDDNVFVKNEFWQSGTCRPTVPLSTSFSFGEYVLFF